MTGVTAAGYTGLLFIARVGINSKLSFYLTYKIPEYRKPTSRKSM